MNNDAQKATSSGQPSDLILKAVRRILKPLVKTLITHGVTYPVVAEMLKRIFVESVDSDFRLTLDQRPTDSRTSLITGVHRKDIKFFRENPVEDDYPKVANSLGAQIIAKWMGSPEYTDDKGDPIPLVRFKTHNNTASFEKLVSSISTDIRPRAVLDDLLKRQVLSLGPDNTVILEQSAFIPREDMAELLVHYGRNIHDHIAAAGHNIAGDDTVGEGSRFLERSVYHYGLTGNAVQLLEKMAEKEGMNVLINLNKEAQKLIGPEDTPSEDTKRVTFGIYFYAEDDSEQKS